MNGRRGTIAYAASFGLAGAAFCANNHLLLYAWIEDHMQLPIGTDRPQKKFPFMNFLLIAVNIVIYLLSHHTPANAAEAMRSAQTANLTPGWFRLILDPHHLAAWQFITYQFLHKDFGHIFGNMLFLYVFGNGVNDKLGNAGYLAFYLGGGVLAGVGQVLTHSGPTLGASGAVSAVTGLFFVLLLRTNIRFNFFFAPLYIESMYVILFSFFRDVAEQAMGMGQVAYAAHITGTISGFLIGLGLLLTGLVPRDQYDLLTFLDRWRHRRRYEAIVSGHSARLTLPEQPPPPLAGELAQKISELAGQHRLQEAAQKYLEFKGIGGPQILPAVDLLNIANQLAATNRFEEAALAYEDFLRLHPGAPHAHEVYFILGMIYARAYPHRRQAIDLLQKALPLLSDPVRKKAARDTLDQLSR